MEEIVIVSAGRTAVGKFGGSLAKIPATELGAAVIKAVLERSGLSAEQIGEVIMGQVLAAGVGQNPARQSVIKAGFPQGIPGLTINAVLLNMADDVPDTDAETSECTECLAANTAMAGSGRSRADADSHFRRGHMAILERVQVHRQASPDQPIRRPMHFTMLEGKR